MDLFNVFATAAAMFGFGLLRFAFGALTGRSLSDWMLGREVASADIAALN